MMATKAMRPSSMTSLPRLWFSHVVDAPNSPEPSANAPLPTAIYTYLSEVVDIPGYAVLGLPRPPPHMLLSEASDATSVGSSSGSSWTRGSYDRPALHGDHRVNVSPAASPYRLATPPLHDSPRGEQLYVRVVHPAAAFSSARRAAAPGGGGRPRRSGAPPSSPPAASWFASSTPPRPPAPPPSAGGTRGGPKHKTEMCKYFREGKVCKYGASCSYAHGDDELRTRKIGQWVAEGLVLDARTLRTRPCPMFVITGACPFGDRCCNIHDTRVAGPNCAWLHHSEMMNDAELDVHVTHLHQQELAVLHYGNPYGAFLPRGLLSDKSVCGQANANDDFGRFYALICNGKESAAESRIFGDAATMNLPPPRISEIQRLKIVLKMMRLPEGGQYKYSTTHKIRSEQCMILQTRAFHIVGRNDVTEIPPGFSCGADRPDSDAIIVREIAFGPDHSPSVRRVALWFGLPDGEIAAVTPKDVQRSRRRGRRSKKRAKQQVVFSGASGSPPPTRGAALTALEAALPDGPFDLVRPSDRDALDLAVAVLRHRVHVLEGGAAGGGDRRADDALESESLALRSAFMGLRQGWAAGAWPVNAADEAGGDRSDWNVEEPPVDALYSARPSVWGETALGSSEHGLRGVGSTSSEIGNENALAHGLWESFLSTLEGKDQPAPKKRLGIFQELCKGNDKIPSLPFIRPQENGNLQVRSPVRAFRKSDECWKDILLLPMSAEETNKWETIMKGGTFHLKQLA